MVPVLSLTDCENGLPGDVVSLPDFRVGLPKGVFLPYLAHLLRCHFRRTALVAPMSLESVSAFAHHVCRVVSCCANAKVARIEASRSVAAVHHHQGRVDVKAQPQSGCDTVNSHVSPTPWYRSLAISFWLQRFSPEPALAHDLPVGQESLRESALLRFGKNHAPSVYRTA